MNNPMVICFENLNKYKINFRIPNWHMIDFDDEIKYKADCFFQVNVIKNKTKNHKLYNFVKSQNKPILVCETNLFRQNSFPISDNKCYFRLGWNHFLRCGEFNNKNSPPDRWTKIKKLQKLKIKPWRKKGEYILLILQKPGDSTLNSMYEKYESYENWIYKTINKIRKYSDRPILIRPHIHHKKINFKKFESEKDKIFISSVYKNRSILEGGKSLETDFANAWAVVGYNSNSMVESTLAGIPTFPLDEDSVVWNVSNKNNLHNIENPSISIDRLQWCYDAAYMIWNRNELENGQAWQHLKEIYF
jgi:hypothetical protein